METAAAPPPGPFTVLRDLASSPSTCLDLASDCDRELLLSGSDDGRATVWDLATSKHWYSWTAHEATVLAVALLSTGDDSRGFRCRTLTHGRDGEVVVWGCPAPWRGESLDGASPPVPLWRVSAGVGSYCAVAHEVRPALAGSSSLLMVVPGGLESTSSAAVVNASIDVTAEPAAARESVAGAAGAAVAVLDVDEAGVELVVASASSRPEVRRALESGARLPAVAGRPAYATATAGDGSPTAAAAAAEGATAEHGLSIRSGAAGLSAARRAVADGQPRITCVFEPDDPAGDPQQGLGEDGLPKRAGMLMAAALLRSPAGRAAAAGDEVAEWALLGYDAGRVSAVRTSDASGPWSGEALDSAARGRAMAPEEALVSTSHPALHPVTALAVAPDSSMVAVGTSADFLVLVRVTWEAVMVAREVAAPPGRAEAAPPRRQGAARGIGGVLGGRAARAPAAIEHARVLRPRLEPDRAVQLPRAGVSSVAFAMAGRALIAACWDGRVRVFDTTGGLEQAACLAWHRMSVYSLSVGAQAAGKAAKFASGDKEGRIAVWDLALDD